MEKMVSESNLSSSLQTTTLAVGGALVLVAGVILHQNKDRISSLFVENLSGDEMNRNTDWQKLSIPAQVRFLPSRRMTNRRLTNCQYSVGGATKSYFFCASPESSDAVLTFHFQNRQKLTRAFEVSARICDYFSRCILE